ncbi:rod shape-determining protein RodA [Sphingomonas bacterium]|uniref:rod shape-determining protein RodA n=1 Tax=Sphingomonas bacterium TaxID=1895847 RepID=UPI001576F757|nr:rod shape-determining protein RodA [Sphingomonas bacterium]
MPRASVVPAEIARLPWGVLLLTFAIGAFGLVVLYSAAGGSLRPWALPQGVRFVVFLAGAAALSRVPARIWRSGSLPAYGVLVLLLLFVELLGRVSGGSQRWISLGVFNLQPSELMKPAIVLAMARFYDMLPPSRTRALASLLPAGLMIGVPAGLIMLQPDLGTALMVSAGGVTVMFLAGVPLWLFGAAAVAMPIVGTLAFRFVLHDYQRNRILIFLDPESDPLRTGYHITQSKIAIGSGGVWGKGFLNGTQNHLDYLPEGHTDFALATMMEEWGFVGGCALILGFMLLVRWGVRVGQRAQTRFARLAAAGLATTIFFYFAINMAMVMGLAPVVGVPLPLVSFGGSAQMTVLLCIGILMSLDRDPGQATRW